MDESPRLTARKALTIAKTTSVAIVRLVGAIWMLPMIRLDLQASDSSNRSDQLTDIMSRKAKEGFSGSVLISRENMVLLRQGYGFSNVSTHQKNLPGTLFRIGSLTKAFTGTLTVRLASQGRLRLDEHLNWSQLSPVWSELTPHLLLLHQSGLPELTTEPGFDAPGEPRDGFSRLLQLGHRPLEFKPGSQTLYSNSGYILLGAWLEHVTGQTYSALLGDQIARPAGLSHTYDVSESDHCSRALGYGPDTGAWELASERDPKLLGAAGALVSNIEDLYLFYRALSDQKLLKQPWLDLLLKEQAPGFTYGWRRRRIFDQDIIYQAGQVRGFSAAMIASPSQQVFIVVLANRETHSASAVALELLLSVSRQTGPTSDPSASRPTPLVRHQ